MELPDTMSDVERLMYVLIEKQAEIAALKEALKPFADAAMAYDPDDGDGNDVAWSHDFTIGSLRRARAALEAKQ